MFPEYTTAAEIPIEDLATLRVNKILYSCCVRQKKAQN